jgi:hypothetical protein
MEAVVIGLVLGSGYMLSRGEQESKKSMDATNKGYTAKGGGSAKARPHNTKLSSVATSFRSTPVKGSKIRRPRHLTASKSRKGRPDTVGYHTNMFPYFGSTIKQNTDPNANKQILDYMVGSGSVDIGKRETPQMFNRERQDIGTPFGAPNKVDEQKEHFVNSRLRQNELPFEQVRSGPGLNDGYTNIPSGGVQQSATRDAALRRYKTVDELRVLSDPKMQYAGVPMNPEAIVKSRGRIGEFKHRNPDRFYVNKDGERNLVTTGQYRKQRVYPQPVDRAVNRPSTSREYFGTQKYTDAPQSYVRPAIRHSHRTATKTFPAGPSVYSAAGGGGSGNGGGGEGGDYGRDGFQALPNQRTVTGSRTKFAPAYGAASANQPGPNHYPDEARFGRKMYFEGAEREYGNMQYTYPQGLPAKDPNDIARLTIREQTEERNWVAPGLADVPTERSRKAERNMRQNHSKEKIARGREPAPQGAKVASGKGAVRIKTRKIESDYFNQYERAPTNLLKVTTNRSVLGKTQIRPRQGEHVHVERSDPSYLHPLRSNPYVISVAGRPPQENQSKIPR